MSREFKDKYIKRWYNIGGPLGGSLKSVSSIIGGHKEIYLDLLKVGLSFEN